MDEFGSFAAQIFDSIPWSVPGGAWTEKRRRMIERTSTVASRPNA